MNHKFAATFITFRAKKSKFGVFRGVKMGLQVDGGSQGGLFLFRRGGQYEVEAT